MGPAGIEPTTSTVEARRFAARALDALDAEDGREIAPVTHIFTRRDVA